MVKCTMQGTPFELHIGIPNKSNLPTAFVNSLIELIRYTEKQYPECKISYQFREDVRTDRNRNHILKAFLESDAKYLLFLDADMTYPKDMIKKYIEADKDIIGGIYVKRSPPHTPLVYMHTSAGKFGYIDVFRLEQGVPNKVDGIATGGMFIKKDAVLKMFKQDMHWFKYGDDYHLPVAGGNQVSHDLMYCIQAERCGVEIWVHEDVKMGHITENVVTLADYVPEPAHRHHVSILIPSYGADAYLKLATTLNTIVENTAGADYTVFVTVDGDPELAKKVKAGFEGKDDRIQVIYQNENIGYGQTINKLIQNNESKYYIYLAQDVLVGYNWLTNAISKYEAAFPDGDGLLTFNDGKKYDMIANHGMVTKKFIDKYTGETLFHPGYKHYNVDLELSHVANSNDKLAYADNSVVFHAQAKRGFSVSDKSFDKAREVIDEDQKLFLERKANGFPKH